jgi:hypothetical protein
VQSRVSFGLSPLQKRQNLLSAFSGDLIASLGYVSSKESSSKDVSSSSRSGKVISFSSIIKKSSLFLSHEIKNKKDFSVVNIQSFLFIF